MVLKGSDGNVSYQAKGADIPRSDKSYEGKQLSRGFTFNISVSCTKK
ncbi:MAG: hypothetical protein JWQ24_1551 [Tardiphaga sp.]|nr:hypothetical protein [Tardiphaga sp.]